MRQRHDRHFKPLSERGKYHSRADSMVLLQDLSCLYPIAPCACSYFAMAPYSVQEYLHAVGTIVYFVSSSDEGFPREPGTRLSAENDRGSPCLEFRSLLMAVEIYHPPPPFRFVSYR